MSYRLAAGCALALAACADDTTARLDGATLCTDCAPGAVRRTVTTTAPLSQIAPTGDGGLALMAQDTLDGGPVLVLDAALANERVLDPVASRLAAAGNDLYVADDSALRRFDAAGDLQWEQPLRQQPFAQLSAGADGAVWATRDSAAIEQFAAADGALSTLDVISPLAVADPAGGVFVTSGVDLVRFDGTARTWTQTLRGAISLTAPTPLPDHRVAVHGAFTGAELRLGDLVLPNAMDPDLAVAFVAVFAADGAPVRLAQVPGLIHSTLVAAGDQLLLVGAIARSAPAGDGLPLTRERDVLVLRIDDAGATVLQHLGGPGPDFLVEAAGTGTGVWLVIEASSSLDAGGVSLTPANGRTIAVELAL